MMAVPMGPIRSSQLVAGPPAGLLHCSSGRGGAGGGGTGVAIGAVWTAGRTTSRVGSACIVAGRATLAAIVCGLAGSCGAAGRTGGAGATPERGVGGLRRLPIAASFGVAGGGVRRVHRRLHRRAVQAGQRLLHASLFRNDVCESAAGARRPWSAWANGASASTTSRVA